MNTARKGSKTATTDEKNAVTIENFCRSATMNENSLPGGKDAAPSSDAEGKRMLNYKAYLTAAGLLLAFVMQYGEPNQELEPRSFGDVIGDGLEMIETEMIQSGESTPAADPEPAEVETVQVDLTTLQDESQADSSDDSQTEALGAFRSDRASIQRGNDAMLQSQIDGISDQLELIYGGIETLNRKVADKDDVQKILDAVERNYELIVKYEDAHGKTKSVAVQLDSNGQGSEVLSQGSTVQSIGGLSLSDWNQQNPSSQFASDGSPMVASPVYQVPVQAPVQTYQIPNVTANIQQLSTGTSLNVNASPDWLGSYAPQPAAACVGPDCNTATAANEYMPQTVKAPQTRQRLGVVGNVQKAVRNRPKLFSRRRK